MEIPKANHSTGIFHCGTRSRFKLWRSNQPLEQNEQWLTNEEVLDDEISRLNSSSGFTLMYVSIDIVKVQTTEDVIVQHAVIR